MSAASALEKAVPEPANLNLVRRAWDHECPIRHMSPIFFHLVEGPPGLQPPPGKISVFDDFTVSYTVSEGS